MSLASRERAAFADLLNEVGPEAATLCDGWTTRELAAHVAVRDRRPDALPGIAFGPLAGWTQRLQEEYAARPYDELVDLVRSGPGRLSPFALPGMDALANATECLVHHEDVRRAQPGWQPRDLPTKAQDAIWGIVKRRATWSLRRLPARVEVRRTDADESCVTGNGDPRTLTLAGAPLELLLYLFGRREHANVEISGHPEAQAALRTWSLTL